MSLTGPSESRLGDWVLTLKNLLLPQFCRQCDARILTEENGFFCPTCWEASPRIQRPFCSLCGRPHEGSIGFGPPVNYPCAECREEKATSRAYDRVYGAATYEGPIAETIKLLKFNDRPRAAKLLAGNMIEFMERELEVDRYTVLVPVPLHRVRHRARGFNQAELLANELLPKLPNAALFLGLRRVRPTRTQSWLKSPLERRDNVKGAFAVENEAAIAGATVLLVDDVVTTSVTVNECARALRAAGATHVDVMAAAVACGNHADTPLLRNRW